MTSKYSIPRMSGMIFILFLLTPALLSAQGADFLRSTGKIYSVVAVIVILFIGLAYLLIKLDNKLTKLENHIKNE